MEQDRHWARYLGKAVEIIYDEQGVVQLGNGDWDIFVTHDNAVRVATYGSKRVRQQRKILALAKWCEEGLQWNA